MATSQFPIFNFQRPGTTPPTNPAIDGVVNQAIPGFQGLNTGASDIISNLMSGLPSSGPTKRANAYFGAGSGMPGSDFVRNRGFDLYNEKADQYQQRGLDDFLKLIQGYSGTVMPTAGQKIEQNQFDRNYDLENRKFDANNYFNQQELRLKEPIKTGSVSGRFGGGPGTGRSSEYKSWSDYYDPASGRTYSKTNS